MTGVELIAAERERHVGLGFTSDHDDSHRRNQLAYAAEAYLRAARVTGCGHSIEPFRYTRDTLGNVPIEWPTEWLDRWDPSQDTVRNLVKAGALIAAEIDRLQRRSA